MPKIDGYSVKTVRYYNARRLKALSIISWKMFSKTVRVCVCRGDGGGGGPKVPLFYYKPLKLSPLLLITTLEGKAAYYHFQLIYVTCMPHITIRQGSSKIISLYRGIVISKILVQRHGRKLAENIVISGAIDWQGREI